MAPGEMHPIVVRELADAVAEPLSTIFEESWQSGEVLGDRKNGNMGLIFKKSYKEDLRSYQLGSLTSMTDKM